MWLWWVVGCVDQSPSGGAAVLAGGSSTLPAAPGMAGLTWPKAAVLEVQGAWGVGSQGMCGMHCIASQDCAGGWVGMKVYGVCTVLA